MNAIVKQIQPAFVALVLLTLLLGGIYPLTVLAINQTVFPTQSDGALIRNAAGKVIGSEHIGQSFTRPEYLWGRLSATGGAPYNAGASSGSNLGVNNPALVDAVQARLTALGGKTPVPVDLVTASGSGLDPHISPAAADYQVARIAAARGMSETGVRDAIARSTQGRTLGILGEPRVHVLQVNQRLDGQLP